MAGVSRGLVSLWEHGSVTSRDTFRQVAGGDSVVASRGPACLRWCCCCQVIGDTFG